MRAIFVCCVIFLFEFIRSGSMLGSHHETIAALARLQVRNAINAPLNLLRTKELDESFLHVRIENRHVHVLKAAPECKEREASVLSFLQKVCDQFIHEPIQGTFVIGLHDTYPGNEYEHVLVFSKHKNAHAQILLPDMYAMENYGGKLGIPDAVPHHSKTPGAFFIGCTTGDTDPAKNRRLQLCDWACRQGGDQVKAYISFVVQMNHTDVFRTYPNADSFVKNYIIEIPHQLQYKYNINMDGNTCAWDRLAWILASNSVCLKERTDNVNWYYPLLQDGVHYIGFDHFDELPGIMSSSDHNDDDIQRIVKNANEFAKTYLTHESHVLYAGYVLYYWGQHQKERTEGEV